MVLALIRFKLDFILQRFFAAVNKKMINVEFQKKRITGVKSLSVKVGVVHLSIWLFVFIIGQLETFGVNVTYFCENPRTRCYSDQKSIVDALKKIVRVSVESVHKGKSTIEIGARLGYRWYPKSESILMIVLVGVTVWGAAIIFVLGFILYRVVIEPLVQKKKIRTE